MGSLEEDDEDPVQGGGDAVVAWLLIQSRRTVSVALWCRDVGG